MKFGKSLSSQIVETLPEWRDKFLSYKDLKKRLKLIGLGADGEERQAKRARVSEPAGDGDETAAAAAAAMTPEEADFMRLLEAELDKFNSFFVEKEEEYIIRQKELQDRVARAAGMESREELLRVHKEIVDFHGEMVLLENYSALNYTALLHGRQFYSRHLHDPTWQHQKQACRQESLLGRDASFADRACSVVCKAISFVFHILAQCHDDVLLRTRSVSFPDCTAISIYSACAN